MHCDDSLVNWAFDSEHIPIIQSIAENHNGKLKRAILFDAETAGITGSELLGFYGVQCTTYIMHVD